MRYLSILTTSLTLNLAPFTAAFAHFGLTGDDDIGHELFWLYGILLASVAGFFIYRKFWTSNEPPEVRMLKRKISELERALKLSQTQIQNALDYPKECGLTDQQRKERLESIASIRGQITTAKADLAAT